MTTRRIRLWLGDLAVDVPTQLLHNALDAQTPEVLKGSENLEPKAKLLRMALKVPARMALALAEAEITKAGAAYPIPDYEVAKADVLGYTVNYFLDLILYGLSSRDWIAEYEDTQSGLEVTGLVAPDDVAGNISGGDSPATAIDTEQMEQSTENNGSAVGSMVHSGDDGQRQDDVYQGANLAIPVSLAIDASLHRGQ